MIEKVSKKIKFLAAVMGSLLITTVSAFGMYGVDGDDWIGFLTHGNQFRARMDQLGFVLGNGTIKGTFGFRADTGWMGSILRINQTDNAGANNNSPVNTETGSFNPTISAGIGYTSDAFGIGVGYNFTYIDRFVQVHTPVVVLNALNNNLRLAIPIQIAIGDKIKFDGTSSGRPVSFDYKYTAIGFNNMELRYLTGIDAFNQIRVYASYNNATAETDGLKGLKEEFGLQLRLYFLNTQIGNVTVNPYVRIEYHQALKGTLNENYLTVGKTYSATDTFLQNLINGGAVDPLYISSSQKQSDIYDVSPFRLFIKPVLSLAANSDIVSLYFEPSLGYAVASSKYKGADQVTTHALNWGAYAEMYVRPVQDLEWYFEMDVNGNVTGKNAVANVNLPPVLFETTTGITWYLPSLGGDTAAQ